MTLYSDRKNMRAGKHAEFCIGVQSGERDAMQAGKQNDDTKIEKFASGSRSKLTHPIRLSQGRAAPGCMGKNLDAIPVTMINASSTAQGERPCFP
jgi:hypothetical protein